MATTLRLTPLSWHSKLGANSSHQVAGHSCLFTSCGKPWKKCFLNRYHNESKALSKTRSSTSRIKATAAAAVTEVIREPFLQDEPRVRSWRGNGGVSTIPTPKSNQLDDPLLWKTHDPDDYTGCSLFAVIMEWEGVIVEDDDQIERKAWLTLAEEEGESPPVELHFRRLEGMKTEQAISDVLHWSTDPLHVRRLALRKEELFHEMHAGCYIVLAGSMEFVCLLKRYNILTALTTVRPRKYLDKALESVGMKGVFDVVVTAEDISRGKPDPEMFLTAARLLDFISNKCIVFGSSNSSVEAAHDIYMKCVGVASKHAVFELGAADIVVERLDELSILDLKKLADIDLQEFELATQDESETESGVEDEPSEASSQGQW